MTPQQRRKQTEYEAKHRKLPNFCPCGNPSVTFKLAGFVCQKCLDIEARLDREEKHKRQYKDLTDFDFVSFGTQPQL